MGAKTCLPLRHVLLATMTTVWLVECGKATPTATLTAPAVLASPSFTPAPPYIHYTSPRTFNSHLEFDYPGHWYFYEGEDEHVEGWYDIFLADPEVLTVPTRAPSEPHGTPSSFGEIYIWIRPIEPGQTLGSLVRGQKRIDSNASFITPLQDYPIEIDGYDAYVLEVLIDAPEMYTSVMFQRRIFFIAYDQVYMLDFTVPQEERGGEFEKGYEYFLDSLRIVP